MVSLEKPPIPFAELLKAEETRYRMRNPAPRNAVSLRKVK